MFSFRSYRSTRKWMLKKKKKPTFEAPPLCAKHRCELAAFDCNEWGVVACRCCVNLRPKKKKETLRDEALHRSSDLIFKFLANDDGNDDFASLVKDMNRNGKDLDVIQSRFSIPVKIGGNNAKMKNTGKLKSGFSEIKSSTSPLHAYKEAASARPPTFIYGVNTDDGEELSVYGLLGRILQDVHENSDKDLASECLDFVKKACEEDPSLGNLTGTKNQTVEDKKEETKVSDNKHAKAIKRNVQKSRKTFTALVHLEEQDELLSVHGLLGRILQNLCEKSQDSDSRFSRPISITEYVTLMRKACEEDSDLGVIEDHMKTDLWRRGGTHNLTHVEDAIAVTANVSGDFAVIDKIKERVVVFDPAGDCKAILNVSDAAKDNADFSPPQSIATSPCGHYYIVDGTKFVKIYDRNCNFERAFKIQVPNVRPTCIAIDSKGNIIVADKRNKVILLCTPDGTLLKEINTLAKPNCLAANGNKILFSDIDSLKVYALDYNGTLAFTMDTLIAGIKYRTTDICCGVTGDVYAILNSEETGSTPICRFNQYGQLLGCVVRDLQGLRGLCFSVTDELLVVNDKSVLQFTRE